MRAYIVPTGCKAIEQLRRIERPDPEPGVGQLLLEIRAVSLNFRDQAVVAGTYAGGAAARDLIPVSDGAGEVIGVGPGVTAFKAGDRVAGTFFQTPPLGGPFGTRAALGSPLDGMLAERVVLYEDGVVSVPPHLSYQEAACLPCAGVTVWHALTGVGRPAAPGDTLLTLGTGGVSIFALQFGKAAGMRVIITSSSDEKLARARALGADDAINYTRTQDWDQEVLKLTGGRGVDCVIEVGGAATLNRSFHALARGGKVALIGVLTGRAPDVNPYTLMPRGGSLHGIFVGDRDMFERMNRAIEVNAITPVIDRVFPFDAAVEAYRYQASGAAIGKVVIAI